MGLRPSLWLSVTVGPVALVLAAGIAILVATGIEWRDSTLDMWQQVAVAKQAHALLDIDMEVRFVKLAAEALQTSDPQIFNQALPNSSYDLVPITRLYNSLAFTADGRPINSLGLYRHIPGTPATDKVSWQITTGYSWFGCKEFGYFYSDPSIYPSFVGYCSSSTGVVDWSNRVYNGSDYGMSPEYIALADGSSSEMFLPVQVIEKKIMLSYYRAFRPAQTGPAYAVTFAELFLDTFSNTVSSESFLRGLGVLYVVEVSTKGMVAANVAWAVSNSTGGRNFVSNTPAAVVRDTYDAAYSAACNGVQNTRVGNWLIGASIYSNSGIEWLIVVVAPADVVFKTIFNTIATVAGVCAACLVLAAASWFLLAWFKIKRPLDVLMRRDSAEVKNLLTERLVFNEIAQVAEKGDRAAPMEPPQPKAQTAGATVPTTVKL